MPQFASADELGDLLGESFTGTRLTQAVAQLETASVLIQNSTRQRLEFVADDQVVLRGVWDRHLILPERPVLDATVTAIDGIAPVAGSYYLLGSALARDGGWGGPGVLVEVTYSHGYDPIPDDIRVATLNLAAELLSRPRGVVSEGIGSYQVTYGPETRLGAVLAPVLSRYRVQAMSVPIP